MTLTTDAILQSFFWRRKNTDQAYASARHHFAGLSLIAVTECFAKDSSITPLLTIADESPLA